MGDRKPHLCNLQHKTVVSVANRAALTFSLMGSWMVSMCREHGPAAGWWAIVARIRDKLIAACAGAGGSRTCSGNSCKKTSSLWMSDSWLNFVTNNFIHVRADLVLMWRLTLTLHLTVLYSAHLHGQALQTESEKLASRLIRLLQRCCI